METKLRRIRNSRAVKLWELRRDPCATHNDNLAHWTFAHGSIVPSNFPALPMNYGHETNNSFPPLPPPPTARQEINAVSYQDLC